MGWRDAKNPTDKPSARPPSSQPPQGKARQASWRNPRGSAAPEGAVRRGWWKSQHSDQRRELGYRAKLALWTLLLVGLLAAFAWVLPQWEDKVPLIALRISDYRDFLPPNAWAAEDQQRFADQFASGDANVAASVARWEASSRAAALADLGQRVADAAPGGPLKNVILVYLSAHGVVDASGAPCLLLSGSAPLDESTWLPLGDVLDEIARQHPGKKKLVVLDCNRMLAQWSCGLLYNSFAERLAGAVAERGGGDLVVLNSTGPGQLGWGAPELGGSAFGYYFFQGLRGSADADHDGQVRLHELAGYLARSVETWTLEHRFGHQRPLVVPSDAADFALAYAEGGPGSYAADERARLTKAAETWHDNPDWAAIDRLWEQHGRLREAQVYRYDPLGWGRLEHDLLRLEQLMLAGAAYQNEQDRQELIRRAEATAKALADTTWPVAACNLPLAERAAGLAPAADTPPAEPDAPPRPYHVGAAALCDRLAAAPLSPALIRKELAAFDKKQAQARTPAYDVAEIKFLRLLERHADADAAGLELALRTRRQAEIAATPADPRAQYWLAAPLAEADQARRQAEDLLFVGNPPPAAAPRWDVPAARYEGARRTAEEVARAFELRDRSLAEAPYLAEWLWLERLAPSGLGASISRASIVQLWTGLSDSFVAPLRALCAELDEAIAREGADDDWQRPRDALAATQQQLADVVEQYYQHLTSRQPGHQERAAAAERLLFLPALTAGRRKLLREKQHETLFRNLQFAQQRVADATADDLDDAQPVPAEPGEKELVTSADAAAHPIVALLDDFALADEPANTAAADTQAEIVFRLAAQGGVLRKRLAQAPRVLAAGRAAGDTQPGAKAAELRAPLSQADRALRSLVAVFNPPDKLNPSARLSRFDFHQLLLGQCVRAMDDFWGPSQAPYFQVVAADCLAKADALDEDDAAEPLRDRVQTRLDRLVAAAARPLAVGVAAPLAISRSADPTWVLLPLGAELAAHVPPGLAAVSLEQDARDPQAALVPLKETAGAAQALRRLAVPLAAGDAASAFALAQTYVQPQPQWLPGAGQVGAAVPKTVAFYRGHEFRQPLPVIERGVPIEFKPDEPSPPTVTVKGDETVQVSLILIFDCSATMDQSLSAVEQTRRIDAAVPILEALLDQLLDWQAFHVGVLFYGHRFTYQIEDNRLVRNAAGELVLVPSAYAKAHPPRAGVLPPDDVEEVLRVKAFNAADLQNVKDRLRLLKPHGQTPLYLAIADAAGALARNADDRRVKRIVAITDGFNDQHNSAARPMTAGVLNERLRALRQDGVDVQVDIVGVGDAFTADPRKSPAELAELRRELTDMAKTTGGQFYPSRNAEDFRRHLEQSLRPAQFEVAVQGAAARLGPKSLNQALPVTPAPKVETPYVVTVRGIAQPATSNVWLAGGEAAELWLDPSGLYFRPYSQDVPEPLVPVSLPPGTPAAALRVASHAPEAPGAVDWVEFYVSVQNTDRKLFTRRPAEAWVEVTPLREDGAPANPYSFCDMSFKPHRPVPVLVCQAPQYPKRDSRKARIEVWFKTRPTRPELEQPVEALTAGERFAPAGALIQARPAEGASAVIVRETPLDPTAGYRPGQIKVEMASPDGEPPLRVQHDYSGGGHLFAFAPGTRLQQCVVKVTSRRALEQDACHYKLDEQVLPRDK